MLSVRHRFAKVWYDESAAIKTGMDILSTQIDVRDEEKNSTMKAVKTHVGRCDTCGEPAAYAQLLPGGRSFRFCEQHAPLIVKKQADAAENVNKENLKK